MVSLMVSLAVVGDCERVLVKPGLVPGSAVDLGAVSHEVGVGVVLAVDDVLLVGMMAKKGCEVVLPLLVDKV